MKNLLGRNEVGVSMSSVVYSFGRQPKRLLSLSACQDHLPSATSKHLPKIKQSEYFSSKNNRPVLLLVIKNINDPLRKDH